MQNSIHFNFYSETLIFIVVYLSTIIENWGAAFFTPSKNTDAVFLAKSVKKWVCFCPFLFEVYNWQ